MVSARPSTRHSMADGPDYAAGVSAILRTICSADGRRTFRTSPSFSHTPISSPDRSGWRHDRPWKAEVGKTWWLWCHDSPSEGSASTQLLVEWSAARNGRRPKKWQIELTLQVTWWLKNSRTRPPHTSPVKAPFHVPVISPPSTNG